MEKGINFSLFCTYGFIILMKQFVVTDVTDVNCMALVEEEYYRHNDTCFMNIVCCCCELIFDFVSRL